MSARTSDLGRVQEIHDLICLTQRQITAVGITEERFKNPMTDIDQLLVEGIMNRVFRVVEEAGALSDDALGAFGLDRRNIRGVRNRLAHAYGEVDAEIIWKVVEEDFEELLGGCRNYCEEHGLELA